MSVKAHARGQAAHTEVASARRNVQLAAASQRRYSSFRSDGYHVDALTQVEDARIQLEDLRVHAEQNPQHVPHTGASERRLNPGQSALLQRSQSPVFVLFCELSMADAPPALLLRILPATTFARVPGASIAIHICRT